MREKYTALCPVPVILSTLLFRDSLSTTPTLALARGHERQTRAIARPTENNIVLSSLLFGALVGSKKLVTNPSMDKAVSPLFSNTQM